MRWQDVKACLQVVFAGLSAGLFATWFVVWRQGHLLFGSRQAVMAVLCFAAVSILVLIWRFSAFLLSRTARLSLAAALRLDALTYLPLLFLSVYGLQFSALKDWLWFNYSIDVVNSALGRTPLLAGLVLALILLLKGVFFLAPHGDFAQRALNLRAGELALIVCCAYGFFVYAGLHAFLLITSLGWWGQVTGIIP